MTMVPTASVGNLAGTPILNLNTVPQQVPVGKGCTLINPGTNPIILSTDAIATAANSFVLSANGASLPITSGPLWASVVTGVANLVVIPQVLNIFNPNVLSGSNIVQLLQPQTINLIPVGGTASLRGIPLPGNIRTVIVVSNRNAFTSDPTNVIVEGDQSQAIYVNQPPYLDHGLFIRRVAVTPVIPLIDSTLTVLIGGYGVVAGAAVTVSVYGDTGEYDESIFYNGIGMTANQSPTNATATLVTGPARILALSAFAQNGAVAVVSWNGVELFRSPSTSTTGVEVPFPLQPNTILPALQTITVLTAGAGGAAFGAGKALYAYP